jgi:hypothetical protein
MAAAAAGSAQTIANPDRLPPRFKTFERTEGDRKLRCNIRRVNPRLNFGFRFQTGYSIEVPLRQYSPGNHSWSAVLRVTPEESEREPVWLVSRARIPSIPETKATAQFGGAFLVGEGKYRVDIMLVDDSGRSCTADWNIRAKLSDDVREVRPGLPRGAVDDISLRLWRSKSGLSPVSDDAQYDISILLHAAATAPNRMRLRQYDRMLLMSSLVSMLERLPVRNVRLTVFTMDRQKELYHTSDLTAASFGKALDALDALELGTVDFDTLQNRRGHVDLLSELLNRELSAGQRADAVIFLGPLARWTESIRDESLPAAADAPPVYYIQLRPWRTFRPVQPDTISRAVRKMRGRTKEVYTPDDFAEAIQEVERILTRAAD